jgi:hypothetical protein
MPDHARCTVVHADVASAGKAGHGLHTLSMRVVSARYLLMRIDDEDPAYCERNRRGIRLEDAQSSCAIVDELGADIANVVDCIHAIPSAKRLICADPFEQPVVCG